MNARPEMSRQRRADGRRGAPFSRFQVFLAASGRHLRFAQVTASYVFLTIRTKRYLHTFCIVYS
jgi:hypothetical protein